MEGKKIKDLLDWVETEDLYKVLHDLDSGHGKHLKKLIEEKLEERNMRHKDICSNCAALVDKTNPNTYTLIFGPHDLRKKATFCGMDCMESFLSSIKEIRR